ncbi:uncharacterized protein LOC144875863 isoform X2 [Branchiostoma floridae x Branchiostoma japonicum]
MRCHAVYAGTDVKYRYCLNLTIADDQTLCDVAVFGTCLEPFFGTSANGLKSFLDDHLKASKASAFNDPDSLLHKALQHSLVGLMLLFGFKVKCKRSRSQRERHSPVRIRNILEKIRQQTNGYHGKTPQLVAHQMVHANRDTPFVSVVDFLKRILEKNTDDDKTRSIQFGITRNSLSSRRSVVGSDVSWCSSSSSRGSFGQSFSRVSLGQQSLVLSCDESTRSGTDSLISSSMSSDDAPNESMERTDFSIHHSSQDETYLEEDLDGEACRLQANDYGQNEMFDKDVRMENRIFSATGQNETNVDTGDDVDVPNEMHEGRQEKHSDTSRYENISMGFLEGAFDETCWEGEIPGNLCQEGQQIGELSHIGDGAMGGSAQKKEMKDAAMMGKIGYALTNQETSDETCRDADEVPSYPQHLREEASMACDVPTYTEDGVPLNKKSSFDESINDSCLLLADVYNDRMALQRMCNETSIGDQNQDVSKGDGDTTHHHSSSDEDIQQHVTKTSCDDLPYSEGLDTFIDQLDQPVQDPPDRLCQASRHKDVEDSDVEDEVSKHDSRMTNQERENLGTPKNCTEDSGLNTKQPNAKVEHVGEDTQMQAMWQEEFPYSEDLDAFLAEMDENVTVESERKDEVDVFREPGQSPIDGEADLRVISVETTVDIHPDRTVTGSTTDDMEGGGENLSFNDSDKTEENADKKGSRTKSLFEQLVRRKTLMALNSELSAKVSDANKSTGKGTEREDSREDTGETDSENDSMSHDAGNTVSDTDSALTSLAKQSSVGRSGSNVSIPDSKKGEEMFRLGKRVAHSRDSTENAVFTTASVEHHDFSALFDDSFGGLSDTKSPDSCRKSSGGRNELPDTPAPLFRSASLVRPSKSNTRIPNTDTIETSSVTNNGRATAATRMPTAHNGANSIQMECRNFHAANSDCGKPTPATATCTRTTTACNDANSTQMKCSNFHAGNSDGNSSRKTTANNGKSTTATRVPTVHNGAPPTQTECDNVHAVNSDCDSPDSSPNELADTPYDSRCRSFLSVRGMLSFNSTADDGKCPDSAYSSSTIHPSPSAGRKKTSTKEPTENQETHRRKSVHFSSHLESVHEISQPAGSEEVFDDCTVSNSVLKSLPTASHCLRASPRKSPLQSIDNYDNFEGTPELYSQRLQSDKKTVNSVARFRTPMSYDGTPNLFSQLSPTSTDRRHVGVEKYTRMKSVGNDSTPNFFSQFSPHDSDSGGIIPGTEEKPNRRMVSCMLKDVVRYPADNMCQSTPDLFETSSHGGSEGGDLGASPDLFGDSPIPDSPVSVRHTGVMSLCKRLFHRQ